jgi:hypothetical protein
MEVNNDKDLQEKDKDKDEDDEFKVSSLLDLVRKLGFIPYALVCLGILTEIYYGKFHDTESDSINHFIKLLSAVLYVSGILWALVRLFSHLFANRPARGLMDGLFAGIFAGFVGGQFGYGWEPMAPEPANHLPYYTQYAEPGYIRVLLAVVFTVPIGAILGLGCDLIHADRKIKWRRDLGIILLVSSVLLIIMGFGLFRYVPVMKGRGISFSNLLFLFEMFLMGFCCLMAWNFQWKASKAIGRLLLMVILIAIVRIATGFMVTRDPEQPGVALWQRQFLTDDAGQKGQEQYDMALSVALMCIATVAAYAMFYTNNILTTRIDKLTRKFDR